MTGQQLQILLIEDNPGDATLIEEYLTSFQVAHVDRLAKGLQRLARGEIDVALLDLNLPDSQGLETFRQVKAQAATVPVVVLSALDDEPLALQAVHEGAQDYLVKGQVNGPLLVRSLRYAVERKRVEEALAKAAAELARSNQRLQQLAADMEELARAEHQARLDLQHAHQQLQKSQSQLVQSAKLAALGQLVAGVAHEINNPLAFVSNNLAVLERDTLSLRDLIYLFQEGETVASEDRADWLRRLHAFAENIDLPYTLDSLSRLLERSATGLKRIQQIVQDLRNFARSDSTAGFQDGVDLNAGIESTCNIISGLAKNHKVEVTLDLATLPPVCCFPGKINQVVLNLLANAIDACSGGGTVTVQTRPVTGGVEIHVIDNGQGINPEIRDKIFDPFFSTKPLGQGVGLGLSISHGIIEEHGGRIAVESTPGHGTHFSVRLPVQPAQTRESTLP